MVKNIKISNFKGISNKIEINFMANAKRKVSKNGIFKVMGKEILISTALMGRNASGKTSFLEAIDFIKEVTSGILYSHALKSIEYKRKQEKEMNNIYDMKIKHEDVINLISEEYFYDIDKKINISIEFIDSKHLVLLEFKMDSKGKIQEKIYSNDNLIIQESFELINYKSNIYDSKKIKLKRVKFLNDFYFFDEIFSRRISFDTFLKNKKNIIDRDMVLDWLRISDTSIKKIIWSSKYAIENLVIRKNGIEKTISCSELSSGSKKWLAIFNNIFLALTKKQSFLYIDEIDRALHPSLAIFLITIFNDKKINLKKSQLFFTSHSPLLVDEPFRKDAINYIDENGDIINLGKLKIREDIVFTKNFIKEKLGSHPEKTLLFDFMSRFYE